MTTTTTAILHTAPFAPVCLHDVVVNEQLLLRPAHAAASRRVEIAAVHSLARLMNAGEPTILKRLAQMAIELCGADSSGVSVLEDGADGKQIFRWRALAGEFEPYEGGSTPREWSPCGACLDAGRPMLYSYPARFFTYFQDVDTTIVEGLVIPMQDKRGPIGTIWIISDNEEHGFDAEDVRVMTSLGAFVTTALRLAERTGSCDVRSEREVVWSELVRRLSRGDLAALEPLIEETRPFVFARALRILSSPPTPMRRSPTFICRRQRSPPATMRTVRVFSPGAQSRPQPRDRSFASTHTLRSVPRSRSVGGIASRR